MSQRLKNNVNIFNLQFWRFDNYEYFTEFNE